MQNDCTQTNLYALSVSRSTRLREKHIKLLHLHILSKMIFFTPICPFFSNKLYLLQVSIFQPFILFKKILKLRIKGDMRKTII